VLAAMNQVAVIIPTLKRADLLRRCLDSLRRQTFRDFRVTIVADGAGNWANDLARESGSDLVRLPRSRGFAAAVNAGIQATSSPYVAVLNDDVELEKEWLRHLVSVLHQHSEVAFCCGKIFQGDSDVLDGAGDALSLSGSAWRLGFGRPDGPEFNVPRPLLAVSGTAALFRRAVFDGVGGLDENFISYLEDMDFSIRLRRAGLRGLYCPAAVARHHGGATLGGPESPRVFELLTRNQLLLVAGNFPAQLLFRLAARIVWAQLLWLAMAVRKRRLGAYLRGCAGFLRLLPAVFRRRPSWPRRARADLHAWLVQSEAAIFADVSSRDRKSSDTFWRMYFLFFAPRARSGQASTAASSEELDRLPTR
jgi:GT2 family glycosyltransferase